MTTIVELISSSDTITLYPEPTGEGWVYNNSTLDAWYALPTADAKLSKRPNANGAYGPGQIYTDAHQPAVNGQFYGFTTRDALVARNRLNALFSEGQSITMRVTDELGSETREVWLLEASTMFRYDFAHFPFDLAFTAPDPLRYGTETSDTEGMPTAGTGLVWNLGTSPSGLYFDWGTEGILGQVEYTNTGSATTFPRIEVGGAGSFASGFRVTEVETGREVTYARSTNTGDMIIIDSRSGRAYQWNGGDVTSFLSSRKWFSVPAGATRRYQINPLGSTAGAPTIALYAAPASL